MNDLKYIINYDDIDFEIKLFQAPYTSTYQCTLVADSLKCAAKIFEDDKHKMESNFINYIQLLQKTIHPGIIPFIGYCSSSQNSMFRNVIITKFAKHLSLQHILDKINEDEIPPYFDSVRKFIIIYGIANTMNYLHGLNIVHQRLTPSNILIDENLEPQISDFSISSTHFQI